MGWQDGTPVAQPDAVPNAPAWQQGTPVPQPQSTLGAIGSAIHSGLRNLEDGLTFGAMSPIVAGAQTLLQGGDYTSNLAAQRAQSQAAMTQSGPVLGTIEHAAGMLPAAALVGGVVGGAGASPLATAVNTGAVVGGLNAAGNGQPVVPGALVGGVAGLGGHALASGLSTVATAAAPAVARVLGIAAPAPALANTSAAEAAKTAAYQTAESGEAAINASAAQRLADQIRGFMLSRSYDPVNEPGGAAVLTALNRFPSPVPPPADNAYTGMAGAPGAAQVGSQTAWNPFAGVGPTAGTPAPPGVLNAGVTVPGVDSLRQVAAKMLEKGGSSASMGTGIIERIDDFMRGINPATDTLSGDVPAAVQAFDTARAANTVFKKSEAVDAAIDQAGRNAGKTGSGGNINNATRQQFDPLIDQNWTPQEEQALRSIVEGTAGSNTLRLLGKLSPSGNGLSAMLNLGGVATGALAGGPAGAAVSAVPALVGLASKALADRATTTAGRALGDSIRNGGVPVPGVFQGAIDGAQPALSRLLTNAGISASVANAPEDSRAASLAALLAQHAPATPATGIGGAFAQ